MRLLGALSKGFRTVFDVPISGSDVSDISGTYSPTVVGGVTVSGGIASFHNSSSERIYYSPVGSGKLRLQTDTEFILRFQITPKGGAGILMSCLNAAGNNGIYIFVNDTFPVVGFYGVGIGNVFCTAPVPINVMTTVKCVLRRSTNQLLIYVDDVLITTHNTLLVLLNNLTNEARYVTMGVLSSSDLTRPLSGSIDYLRINDKTG